jgi:peptidoglycan/LPS O-acetylase OafA/YrhL
MRSMACLQIAIGIWGVLLLAATAIVSSRSAGTMAAVLALLAGTLLAASGGVAGLNPERASRAVRLMAAGAAFLTICALVLLIVALSRNDVNWYFPLGAMFLALAVFSNLAGHRFRKATTTTRSPL